MSQRETCLGKVWKMTRSTTAVGAEMVVYRCCSGTVTYNDGNVEKNMQQQEVLEEARSSEESTWRLEPERGTEVPEIIIVSDAVKGTKVVLDGKGHQMKRMKEIPKKVETAERSRQD